MNAQHMKLKWRTPSTMNTNHTSLYDGDDASGYTKPLFDIVGKGHEEKARHIADCVNACAGITNEQLSVCTDNGILQYMDAQVKQLQQDHDRLAALNAELVETMRHIIAADKTCYEYRGKHAENAAGDKPKAGSRWATPRELAQAAIAKAGVK